MSSSTDPGRRWRLDGLAFTIGLEGLGRDRLPYPLRYRPPEVDAWDDLQRMRMRAARELLDMVDDHLLEALGILLEPQVRVEMHGFYGTNFAQVVRVHAGLVGRIAAVAVQLPGPTQQYGSDVILDVCPAAELPGRLVAALPHCPPGTRPEITGRRSDLDMAEYARHPIMLSHSEKINRIIRRPRSSLGEIAVFRGGAVDSRPTDDGRGFHWLDYQPADGRYLLIHRPHGEFVLTPATDTERRLHDLLLTTRNEAITAAR